MAIFAHLLVSKRGIFFKNFPEFFFFSPLGSKKIGKSDMPDEFSPIFLNFLFSLQPRIPVLAKRVNYNTEKKNWISGYKGVFINPSEFSEKTLVLIGRKKRCRFSRKTPKIWCSWWPLQQGMRLHCDFIIKNGHFWPFLHIY